MEIYIENYPLSLRLGHFKEERSFTRTVLISLTLFAPLACPKDLENLEKTIDYGEVLVFLDEEYRDKTYHLIENLLYSVAKGLIKKFSLLEELSISIEKTFIRRKLVKGTKILVKERFKRDDFL